MKLIPLEFESIFEDLRSNNSFTLVDGAPVWGTWHDDEFELVAKAKVKDSSGGVHKLRYKDGLWSVTYPIDGATYTPCYPYYKHGTVVEVVKSVNDDNSQFSISPLVGLITTEENYESVSDQFKSYDLKMYLCALSDQNFSSTERETNSYQDILIPLLAVVERYLGRYQYLYEDINPKFIQRWGKRGLYGIEGNVFNEMYDALEIKTKLTFNINCN